MHPNIDLELTKAFTSSLTKEPRFATSGLLNALPELHIAGLGDVVLPFRPSTLSKLAGLATQAPYGRGEDTIYDDRVRRAGQLPADACEFSEAWQAELARILSHVEADLGISSGLLVPELYKLLVYETGGFFLPHRDTEKAPGMVATLIVALPSAHEGGHLRVLHEGRNQMFDSASASRTGKGLWMAFYADCEHEVLPVTHGTRVALAYNLVLKKKQGASTPAAPTRSHPRQLESALANWSKGGLPRQLLIHVLEHQYSREGLGFSTLKGADARMAEDLLAVAKACDLEVFLGHVERRCFHAGDVSGGGSFRRGYRWQRSQLGEHDFESHDLVEDNIAVTRLRDASGSPAGMRNLAVSTDEDLFAGPRGIDNLKSLKTSVSEATGNEGATMEKWYRSAALVVWRRDERLSLLTKCRSQVRALRAFTRAAHAYAQGGGEDTIANLLSFVASFNEVQQGYGRGDRSEKPGTVSRALLRAVEAFPHAQWVGTVFHPTRLGRALTGREAALFTRCLIACSPEDALGILFPFLESHLRTAFPEVQRLLVGLCKRQADLPAHAQSALLGILRRLPALFLSWLADPMQSYRFSGARLSIARRFLVLSCLARDADFSRAVCEVLMSASFDKVRDVGTALLAVLKRQELEHSWLEGVRHGLVETLTQSSATEPQPPQDARRNATFKCACADCTDLKNFLADPVALSYELRAAQSRRTHVESSIRAWLLDLDHSTVKTGSPHRLVLRKNSATFERLHARYQAERRLLGVLASCHFDAFRPQPK